MEYFLNTAKQLSEYRAFSGWAGGLPVMLTGLSHIHKAHFLAAFAEDDNFRAPLAVICDTEGECARLCADINAMTGRETAVVYPAKDLMLGDVDSSSREYVRRRLGVLYRMAAGQADIVCATPEGASQLTMPKDILLGLTRTIKSGDTLDLTELAARLTELG